MKKIKFLSFIFLFTLSYGNAQTQDETTILYLLPFHLNEYVDNYQIFRNSAEIYQTKQFEMMGFWLGTKMALQEYENTHKKINVIVRDVGTEVDALHKILNDTVLMNPVNMIIGPVYGSLFPVAASYAKENNIVIVNPFSTRYDFVENNPAVYKLIPPFLCRPEKIVTHFLSHSDDYNIILWGDSVTTPELIAYRYYFNEQSIHFKEVHTLNVPMNIRKKNLIIALFEQPERVIHGVHTLINQQEEEINITLVVPEKWFTISELTEDFYTLPELYFFTNYFVDENSDRIKQFQSNYTFYYEAPAELAAYSYQGYDITRYFIDLFFADFIYENVNFTPLSYNFQWKKIENGGFENIKTRLIRVKNLELIEIE